MWCLSDGCEEGLTNAQNGFSRSDGGQTVNYFASILDRSDLSMARSQGYRLSLEQQRFCRAAETDRWNLRCAACAFESSSSLQRTPDFLDSRIDDTPLVSIQRVFIEFSRVNKEPHIISIYRS